MVLCALKCLVEAAESKHDGATSWAWRHNSQHAKHIASEKRTSSATCALLLRYRVARRMNLRGDRLPSFVSPLPPPRSASTTWWMLTARKGSWRTRWFSPTPATATARRRLLPTLLSTRWAILTPHCSYSILVCTVRDSTFFRSAIVGLELNRRNES